MMTIALNWPQWICLKSPEGQPAGNSRDETGITTPVEHSATRNTQRGQLCVCLCVLAGLSGYLGTLTLAALRVTTATQSFYL